MATKKSVSLETANYLFSTIDIVFQKHEKLGYFYAKYQGKEFADQDLDNVIQELLVYLDKTNQEE